MVIGSFCVSFATILYMFKLESRFGRCWKSNLGNWNQCFRIGQVLKRIFSASTIRRDGIDADLICNLRLYRRCGSRKGSDLWYSSGARTMAHSLSSISSIWNWWQQALISLPRCYESEVLKVSNFAILRTSDNRLHLHTLNDDESLILLHLLSFFNLHS